MSNYFQNSQNAIQRGIASYAGYLDKKEQREYRERRDKVEDEKWGHEFGLRERADLRAQAQEDREAEKYADLKTERGFRAEAALSMGKPRDGIIPIGDKTTVTGFTQVRNTGPTNSTGTAEQLYVQEVGADPETGEKQFSFGVLRSDGNEFHANPVTDNPQDNNSAPIILTESELNETRAHVGKVMDSAYQAGYDDETAVEIGWASINDDGTPATEEELLERIQAITARKMSTDERNIGQGREIDARVRGIGDARTSIDNAITGAVMDIEMEQGDMGRGRKLAEAEVASIMDVPADVLAGLQKPTPLGKTPGKYDPNGPHPQDGNQEQIDQMAYRPSPVGKTPEKPAVVDPNGPMPTDAFSETMRHMENADVSNAKPPSPDEPGVLARTVNDFLEKGFFKGTLRSGLETFRPAVEAFEKIPPQYRPAGMSHTIIDTLANIAGGAGIVAGGQDTGAKFEQATRDFLNAKAPAPNRETAKSQEGRAMVSPTGTVNAHNIRSPQDAATVADYYNNHPEVRAAAMTTVKASDFRGFLDAQGEIRSGKTRQERAKLAAKALTVGGDAQMWFNYIETGNMWLSQEDMEYHQERLAATYRSNRPKGEKQKTREEIYLESEKEFSTIAKRSVSALMGDDDRAGQYTSMLESGYVRYASVVGKYLVPGDPKSHGLYQAASEKFVQLNRSGDFGNIQFGPVIASLSNNLDTSTFSAQDVEKMMTEHATNLSAISAKKTESGEGLDANLVGATATLLGAELRRLSGKGYNTPEELRIIEQELNKIQSNDGLTKFLTKMRQLERESHQGNGGDV